MSKKVLILTAIVLVFAVSNLQAEQISVSWDGGGDGHSWSDANNWDPNIMPDGDFDVTINGGDGGVDIGLQQNRTINRLDCYGKVELQRWTSNWVALTLIDANGLINHGDLEIHDDRFQVNGNINNYGHMEVDSLEISGNVINATGAEFYFAQGVIYGNLYNTAGADMQVDDNVDLREGEVQNNGYMLITPSGEMWAQDGFRNSGEILMYLAECSTNGVFDNDSNGLIEGAAAIHSNQAIQNRGTIYALGGGLVLHSYGSVTNTGILGNRAGSTLHIMPSICDVNNQGTIEVNADGSVTADCNLVNDTNGVIELRGGTLAATTITQTADANFTGFGGITGNVVIDPNGVIQLTGPTNIIGDVNIPAGATLEIGDGQTLITGHTTCDGTIHLIGGTVIFQGGCDCNDCTITHEAGADRNHFDINADGIEDFKDFATFANTWLWQATWY